MKPREYFFRNGVFSLRIKESFDIQTIEEWKKTKPIHVEFQLPIEHNLPNEFMFCFYWIEVGYATIITSILSMIYFIIAKFVLNLI